MGSDEVDHPLVRRTAAEYGMTRPVQFAQASALDAAAHLDNIGANTSQGLPFLTPMP